MQVTETLNDGLKREFKVVVAANDIAEKMDGRLREIGRTVKISGFRPGKVPLKILKQRYGQAVMGEVLEGAVSDSSSQALAEKGLRAAVQPKIEIETFDEGTDLEYKMAVELMPEIEPIDFKALKLERLVAPVTEDDIKNALDKIVESHGKNHREKVDRAAADGDFVLIDFEGSIDGEIFPGGSATGHALELGSGQFIPGFEEQLVGVSADDEKEVKVTFPEDYPSENLAGKEASFKVGVKEVQAAKAPELNDEFAKEIGFDDLEALNTTVKEQLEKDHGQLSRARLKRTLLDMLAKEHTFGVPSALVDSEFEAIWSQLEQEIKGNETEAFAEKSEEDTKAEYREIAERRVRLGLLLSEVGRMNSIDVAQEDLNKALIEEMRRYPGQEKEVLNFYQSNPEAMNRLRAPVYEDKVVDYIIELADVSESETTVDALVADPEDDATTAS